MIFHKAERYGKLSTNEDMLEVMVVTERLTLDDCHV